MPRNAWRIRWFFEVKTSRAASSIRIVRNGFMPRRLIAFSTLVIGSRPPYAGLLTMRRSREAISGSFSIVAASSLNFAF